MTNARARHAVPLRLPSGLRDVQSDGAFCLKSWRGLLHCARNDGIGSGHGMRSGFAANSGRTRGSAPTPSKMSQGDRRSPNRLNVSQDRARHNAPLRLLSGLRELQGEGAISLNNWWGLLRCARNDGIMSGHATPCHYACPRIFLWCEGARLTRCPKSRIPNP